MTLTGTLICAIISRTPTEMKNYRMFLLNVSIADFLVSFATTILQPVPDSSHKEIERPANDSGISYVIMGPVVYFIHPAKNHLLTSLAIGLFIYGVMALPISFFFRYITKKVLLPGFTILVTLCLTAAFCMYAGDMPKSGRGYENYTSPAEKNFSLYYAHKGDSNETRFGNLIHMNYMVYYMLYIAGTSIAVGYSLLVFSAFRLFNVLKKHRSTISKKTHDLQRALALSLVCQSLLPLIFVGIPLIIIISTVASGLYSPVVNSIAMLIFSYQVILSPIIQFTFVRPYRQFINPKRLKKLFSRSPKTSTSRKPNTTKIFTVIIAHNSPKLAPLLRLVNLKLPKSV
uniref:G protein-coupled receptor n=1 Tax=Panagrolaimus sp. JU765 TaxID=591449 RepID=A0AC34QBX1_9BILA